MSKFAEFSPEKPDAAPLRELGLVIRDAAAGDIATLAEIAHERDGGDLERIRQGGGARYHEKAREQGKLFCRDRIARLVDEDSFVEDAAFATGFLHGQDRLFQIDLTRRLAAGRLAELVGLPALNMDRRARRRRHGAVVDRWLNRLAVTDAVLLEAYTRGVNAAVASAGALPPEYAVLRADGG